jgi:hypothetical protein
MNREYGYSRMASRASNLFMETRGSNVFNFPKQTDKEPQAQPTNLIDAGNGLVTIIKSAQRILADFTHPDGITKDQALNDLLSLLEGPKSRRARDVWNASVDEARKSQKA